MTAIDKIDKALECHATLCSSTSPTALGADLPECALTADDVKHQLSLFTTGATGPVVYKHGRPPDVGSQGPVLPVTAISSPAMEKL